MRILYLAHRVPYPPNKGEKIRAHYHLRHLAARHDVHLVCFVDRPEDRDAAPVLRQYCRSVDLIPFTRVGALARGVAALASGRSLSLGYFQSARFADAVAAQLRQHRFDVAWAFSSSMAQYLPESVPLRIADFADVDSDKWRQFAETSTGPLRFAYELEAARLRAFETQIGSAAHHVLFVSPAEAALFRSFAPPHADVRVVPVGVDTTYFEGERAPDIGATLLFTGSLDYRPNVDAVRYCAGTILPRVRAQIATARFVAVGHRPTFLARRSAWGTGGAVDVIGSVPDIRPYFRRAQVYVAPLRLGRGVQNKVLEAMAMRVPVVASPLAVAGLDVEKGRDVLVCETTQEFATAIVRLLRDPEERRVLVENATRVIQTRFLWEKNLRLVDDCLAAQGGHDAGDAVTTTIEPASPRRTADAAGVVSLARPASERGG